MREVSGDAMSKTEAHTAAESLRKLYADLFEETHALRERMWELGTCWHLHRTRDVCNAQAAGSPVVGSAAEGYGAPAACPPRIEGSTPTHGTASLARDAPDSTRSPIMASREAIVVDDADDAPGAAPRSLASIIPDRAQLERERLARAAKRAAQAVDRAPAAAPSTAAGPSTPPRAGAPVAGPAAESAPEALSATEKARAAASLPAAGGTPRAKRPASPTQADWGAYVPKRRAGAATSAAGPYAGWKSADVPRASPSSETSPRYTPISAADRFWRGAIKVRCAAHPGDVQPVRTTRQGRHAPRRGAAAGHGDERERPAARAAHLVRCRDGMAAHSLPLGARDVHRESPAWRPSA